MHQRWLATPRHAKEALASVTWLLQMLGILGRPPPHLFGCFVWASDFSGLPGLCYIASGPAEVAMDSTDIWADPRALHNACASRSAPARPDRTNRCFGLKLRHKLPTTGPSKMSLFARTSPDSSTSVQRPSSHCNRDCAADFDGDVDAGDGELSSLPPQSEEA